MPIDVTSVTELSDEEIATLEEELRTFILEAHPELKLDPGVPLRQLLLLPAATYYSLNNTNVDRLRRSQSLLEISKDPALADDDVVDAVLSNFLVTRREGEKAFGKVVLVIDTLVTTPLSIDTILTASNGTTFNLTEPFLGVVNPTSIVSSRDRLITEREDGNWSFVVDVVAVETGESSRVLKDTKFTTAPGVANLTDAFAESDFEGGEDDETNEELINRLDRSVATHSTADRVSIDGLIREGFEQTRDVSIIGAGDPEMQRDTHNILGVKTGGKADVYVRSGNLPSLIKHVKSAVLVSKADQLWRVDFTRDEQPGLYRIEQVLPVDSTDLDSFEIVEDSRSADVTSDDGRYVPFIGDVIEAVYSPFQTVSITFKDTNTPIDALTENDSRQNYDVFVRAMRDIKEIQDLLGARQRRAPNGDYLVRAPIPAFMSVSLVVRYDIDFGVPNAQDIREAAAKAVNDVIFEDSSVPVSIIIDAVHDVLGTTAYVQSPVEMRATIRQPDGADSFLFSTNELTVADNPQLSISKRTVAFYLESDSVDVQILPEDRQAV